MQGGLDVGCVRVLVRAVGRQVIYLVDHSSHMSHIHIHTHTHKHIKHALLYLQDAVHKSGAALVRVHIHFLLTCTLFHFKDRLLCMYADTLSEKSRL